MKEFNKLAQDKSVDEYVERFEELEPLINALSPSPRESYYFSSFISGLNDDIRSIVKIFKPTILLNSKMSPLIQWPREAESCRRVI